MNPSHGRSAVFPRLCAIQQRAEVSLQIRCILLRGLPVYTSRPILACAPIRLLKPDDIDLMGKCRERHARRFPRLRCYPFKFRGDAREARCLRHLSLERVRDPVPPFARRGPSGRFPHVIAPTAALRLPGIPTSLARALLSSSTLPWKCRDLPGSCGTLPYMPCSRTPAGSCARPSGRCPSLDAPMLPSVFLTTSAPAQTNFEAQSHSLHARCLRFAATVAHAPRKTRFRLVAHLGRTGFEPAGFHREVSACTT